MAVTTASMASKFGFCRSAAEMVEVPPPKRNPHHMYSIEHKRVLRIFLARAPLGDGTVCTSVDRKRRASDERRQIGGAEQYRGSDVSSSC